MPPIRIKCHGVEYIRMGECIRCGECCKTKGCLHFSWDGSLAACNIQQSKVETCQTCMNDKEAYFYKANRAVSHQVCADFPNHPFLRVIKTGVCGYKFEPATGKDKKKHQALVKAWQ